MPAVRNGCSASAMCCTSRASGIGGSRSGATRKNPATSRPNMEPSCMPRSSAMPMPPSRRSPSISWRPCTSSNSPRRKRSEVGTPLDRPLEDQTNQEKAKGNVTMRITRRHILATIAAATVLGASGIAQAADTVRIGLPTKTYWPTTIAETAVRQKLFEKEGIAAELTIYRGGAETFEAMAAGAPAVSLDAPSLPAAGRKKGVMSKVVANAAMGSFGWQVIVPAKSPLDVKDLNGKKVAITSAGSGSDLLALWTIQEKKIEFTRVPVGGAGL